MKGLAILVAAIVMILLITQIEDYLGQQDFSKLQHDKEKIDYYLTNFSIQQINAQGIVTAELAGKHLAHWQQSKQSDILAPIIYNGMDFATRTNTTADTAHIDQNQQLAHLQGHVHSHQPASGTHAESDLYTDYMDYQMQTHVLSTDAGVLIKTPSGTMQSTGMIGKLDADLLEFKHNVRTLYQVK